MGKSHHPWRVTIKGEDHIVSLFGLWVGTQLQNTTGKVCMVVFNGASMIKNNKNRCLIMVLFN